MVDEPLPSVPDRGADQEPSSNRTEEPGRTIIGSIALGVGVAAVTALTKISPEVVVAAGGIAASGGYLVAQVTQALLHRQTSRRAANRQELVERIAIVGWLATLFKLLESSSIFWHEVKEGRNDGVPRL